MTSVIRRTVCLLLLFAVGVTFTWAQNDQTPQLDAKIGFVDSLEILYGTEDGKREIARVQEFIEQKQKEYDESRMELERLKEQLETQQRTLNSDTLTALRRTITEKERKLRRFQEDTQAEINHRRDQVLDKLSEEIQAIIREYAKENGYQAIFLRTDAEIYVDPALDLTEEITEIYNRRHGGSGEQSSGQGPSEP